MAVDVQAEFKNFATSETYVSEVSEIMVNSLAEDDVNGMLTVVPDVTNGAPLAVVDQMDKVTKTDAGCGDNSITKTIGGFQQKWNVKDLGVHIKWCWSDFKSTFLSFGLQRGIRKADLTTADFGDFLESMGLSAIMRDFNRIALMGNENADLVSGAGYFNAGVDVADYNQIERGLDATLAYLATIARFQKNFVYIPQNEITGKQYQFDGADGTKKVSDIAIELEDLAINFDPNHQICNYKMVQGFKKELRDAGAFPTDATRDMLTDGLNISNINGFQTFSSKVYDRYTAADTTGIFTGAVAGTDYHNPNFMVLTTKANLLMGMDEQNAITDVEWFRDPIKDEVHFKCKYRADFKVANPDYLLAAHSFDINA